jgi:hypothetical protein
MDATDILSDGSGTVDDTGKADANTSPDLVGRSARGVVRRQAWISALPF